MLRSQQHLLHKAFHHAEGQDSSTPAGESKGLPHTTVSTVTIQTRLSSLQQLHTDIPFTCKSIKYHRCNLHVHLRLCTYWGRVYCCKIVSPWCFLCTLCPLSVVEDCCTVGHVWCYPHHMWLYTETKETKGPSSRQCALDMQQEHTNCEKFRAFFKVWKRIRVEFNHSSTLCIHYYYDNNL